MAVKTIETYVDVDVDLDEFDDNEIVEELKNRGYTVLAESAVDVALSDEDLEYLLTLLDKQDRNWYNNRVRDKIFDLRYQGKR
jgi:hypothetical protein